MTEDNTSHDASSSCCSADHLLRFIVRIKDEATAGNIGPRPLNEAMPKLSRALGFSDYMEMLMQFMTLAGRVRDDIAMLSLRRENVRVTLVSRLKEIERVFDAQNFGAAASAILNRHFSEINLQALEDISERLEAQGFVEQPLDQLTEALVNAKEAAKTAEEYSQLSPKARMLIKAHLDQLNRIVENFSEMGEQDFWSQYRVLFSAFIELHEGIADPTGKEQSKENIQKMLSRIVLGSSLAANVVTLGAPTMGALGL